MSRELTIPSRQVTEEISNITEVPGQFLRFTVGEGKIKEGVFVYETGKSLEYLQLDLDLYKDFRAKYPTGYVLDNLWLYVDAIRSGATSPPASKYAKWDSVTNTWVDPLDILDLQKADAVLKVDNSASVKILAIYPLYKQNNISRLPTSEEALAMYAYIDSIRALAQTAKAVINAATSIVEIRAAVEGFTDNLQLT